MLEKIPTQEELAALIGETRYRVWTALCALIERRYEMDHIWNSGGKAWQYEYKYRRGGKTLCALYAREDCVGFLVILGKAEREKFEADRQSYSQETQRVYDEATTYHDGKWIMLELQDESLFEDMEHLLLLKRKPNRKCSSV